MLAAAVVKLPVGDTQRTPATVVGPVISGTGTATASRPWIDQAVQDGARLVTGGTLSTEPAYGQPCSPTSPQRPESVLRGSLRTGRLDPHRQVRDLAEAIEEVNSARFGLNTAIFTRDLATALTFAPRGRSGTVLVNITPSFRADHMPYGGVKDSAAKAAKASSTPSPNSSTNDWSSLLREPTQAGWMPFGHVGRAAHALRSGHAPPARSNCAIAPGVTPGPHFRPVISLAVGVSRGLGPIGVTF